MGFCPHHSSEAEPVKVYHHDMLPSWQDLFQSYLADLKKSSLLFTGHILLVSLAKCQHRLQRGCFKMRYLLSYCWCLPDAREQEAAAFRFWSQGSGKLQRRPPDMEEHTSCPGWSWSGYLYAHFVPRAKSLINVTQFCPKPNIRSCHNRRDRVES